MKTLTFVSKATGLSQGTLRKWESRYEVVKPTRVNGNRAYTLDQLIRLKTLSNATGNGIPIKDASKMTNQEIHEQLELLPNRKEKYICSECNRSEDR